MLGAKEKAFYYALCLLALTLHVICAVKLDAIGQLIKDLPF